MNDGVATRAYQRLFQLGRVAGQSDGGGSLRWEISIIRSANRADRALTGKSKITQKKIKCLPTLLPQSISWQLSVTGNESGTKLGEQLIRRAIDQCLAVTVDASYREINFRRPQRGDNGRRHLG